MLVQQLGNADLGADAVGAGHQNRLRHALDIRGKQAAEAADVGHHAGDHGSRHMTAHQLDALVARFNIDSGLPVAVRKTSITLSSFH